MSAQRYLVGAAVLLFGLGVLLRLAPPSSPAPPAPIRSAVAPLSSSKVERRSTLGGRPAVEDPAPIIASNIFSEKRAAPAERLLPDSMRKEVDATPPPPRRPAESPVRVYGITRGAGGAVALIDADPKVPGAEVYRVGDRLRDGTISSIDDSTVTVKRPAGPLVLRLPAAGGER